MKLPADPNRLPPAPTQAMLNAFGKPIWIYDPGLHRISAASPSGAKLWRAESIEELASRDLGPLSPAVIARLAAYGRAIDRGEKIYEQWTLYPKGTPVTIDCTCTGVQTLAGTVAMLVEGTEPTPTEVDNSRLVEALRHDPAPVLLFSWPDGANLLSNPAAHSLFEAAPSLDTLFADGEAPARIRQGSTADTPVAGENRVCTHGGMRIAAWRAARGLDPVTGGEMVAVTLLDVTDVRADTLARLENLSRAVDAAQDGIALTDPAGNFTYMNPAHLRMFGFNRLEEAIGLPWTALYGEVERGRFLREVFPNLTAPGCQWRGNADGVAVDGTVVRQEVSLTIREDGGILCATRDIGRRLEAEAHRRQLEVELAQVQKTEAVGQLVGGLAHDVNNLLLAMMSTASGLAANPTLERVKVGCERIAHAGTQAARIVRRMLDFVRRQEGPPSVKDLRGVLSRAGDLMSALLFRRVQFELILGAEPLPALIREEQVVQILLNLAANARDAVGPDGGLLRVSLGLADTEACAMRVGRGPLPHRPTVEILVVDNGPGIPAEVMGRLFEPYFTTKPAGLGTGLGLSTSASIVEAFGGRIEGWNTGNGAAFRVLLPRAEMPAMPRVLVAHPEPEMAALVARVLELEGFAVVAAEGARAALEQLLSEPARYQLVLAELDAPTLGGEALMAALKEADVRVPVLLTTPGRASRLAMPAGASRLRTPFTASELLAAARLALGLPAD